MTTPTPRLISIEIKKPTQVNDVWFVNVKAIDVRTQTFRTWLAMDDIITPELICDAKNKAITELQKAIAEVDEYELTRGSAL